MERRCRRGRDRFYARLYTGIYTDMRPCGEWREEGGKEPVGEEVNTRR